MSELSVQKQWSEGSDSFRIGIFWFLWGAFFPAALLCFLAFELCLLGFFRRYFFLALVFFLRILRINHMHCVAAKGQLFGGNFEMFGTDILLGLRIRPLASR